jgi:hypothetical protein
VNGIHDLGGMPRLRPRGPRPERAALPRPVGGRGRRHHCAPPAAPASRLYSIDEFRHAIERMPAVRYLVSTHFERCLDGILRILDEKGAVSAAEMDARVGTGTRLPMARRITVSS